MSDRIKLTEEVIMDLIYTGTDYPYWEKIKLQIIEENEIIFKLLETANMDCYENDERIRRDFAKKLLQEKL